MNDLDSHLHLRSYIKANWPAPSQVVAGVSQRQPGDSLDDYVANNMAMHVGDRPQAVAANRQCLDQQLPGVKRWQWLNQIHGVSVCSVNERTLDTFPDADASETRMRCVVCTVLTADCLPVLITNTQGNHVAAIHAGWRGLVSGVIEQTLQRFSPQDRLLAWLGPAIGPQHFEVGEQVRQAFAVASDGDLTQALFIPQPNAKYKVSLYALARLRLRRMGVHHVFGGDYCTMADSAYFYSYRREHSTGRMASFIYFH